MKEIYKVAKKLKLKKDNLYFYGKYSAKITKYNKNNINSNLILVSAMNPTVYGEGKTTISIGLADSLKKLGKNVCLCLREPSMGPVFGMKGGAVGGGKAKIIPENDINLHFNGDLHALTYANNLICAYIDSHIYNGNLLQLNPNNIAFTRCLDINDRALREIEINKENLKKNIKRKESFVITPASELMSIFCLAKDFNDFIDRCDNIIIGYNYNSQPIYFKQLNKTNDIKLLLQQAFYPNLVQTIYQTPCLVHGGPFANISIGTSSYNSIKTAMDLSNYVITEAGFGFDLGGEKFLDIMCRINNLNPKLIVLVCSIRSIKSYCDKTLSSGFEFVKHYVKTIKTIYNKDVLVCLNRFDNDSLTDIEVFENLCKKNNINFSICNSFSVGENGAIDLAKQVIDKCSSANSPLTFSYNLTDKLQTKILDICKNVYGVGQIEFSKKAKSKILFYGNLLDELPVVIAKTPYSLTDDAKFNQLPNKESTIHIDDIELKNGVRFILVKTSKIYLMPGL